MLLPTHGEVFWYIPYKSLPGFCGAHSCYQGSKNAVNMQCLGFFTRKTSD